MLKEFLRKKGSRKMKKKGFTLIELLAVIIILAVIALIATPIVLDVVDNTKERARLESVNGLIDATRLYISEALLNQDLVLTGNIYNQIKDRVGGNTPETGEILIGENNKVAIAVKYDKYCYVKQYDGEITRTESEECSLTVDLEDICYDADVEKMDINYDACIVAVKQAVPSYSDEDVDLICKGEQASDGATMELAISAYGVDSLILADVLDYEINYEVCSYLVPNLNSSYTQEDINAICTGGTASDGMSVDASVQFELLTYQDLMDANVISIKKKTVKECKSCYEYDVLEDGTAEITDYSCVVNNEYNLPVITDVTIPNKIDGLYISSIGNNAFYANNITSVDFSYANNITTIGEGAFGSNQISGKIDLSNITDLTTLGNNAFYNNNDIKEIVINNEPGILGREPWGTSDDTKITYLKSSDIVKSPNSISSVVESLVYENGSCKTDGSTYEYMGGCYLKIGASTKTSNYIWYNGFLWRIMGINSDGSIRMITEENITAISYNVSDNSFSGSHADKWLNEYFYNKLSNENNLKTNVIVSGTFCQGSADTASNGPSRTDCTNGTELTRNIGLLSIDEYNLSGGINSYLINNQVFWTMSPYNSSNAWYVSNIGNAYDISVNGTRGVRPVINVNSNATITSGNGTLSDYYVLEENKGDTNITGTLATAKIGEYVMLNNKRYRVVENGSTTKLILDGYYQETEGTNYRMTYGSNNTFSSNSGIGNKLNTDVLDWLTAGDNKEKLKAMILPSTWYQNSFGWGNSYEVSLNEKNPTRIIENVKVGLIRIGEMLSGQSYIILTKNGTEVSNSENVATYWTMTPYTNSSNAWNVYYTGDAFNSKVGGTIGVRPVINISSTNAVISGNGAPNTPYVIEVK